MDYFAQINSAAINKNFLPPLKRWEKKEHDDFVFSHGAAIY